MSNQNTTWHEWLWDGSMTLNLSVKMGSPAFPMYPRIVAERDGLFYEEILNPESSCSIDEFMARAMEAINASR